MGKNNSTEKQLSITKICTKCIISGIWGFVIFLLTIIVSKYVGFLIHSFPNADLYGEDYLLAMIGFVLMFLIKFLEQFKNTESEYKKSKVE